MHALENKVFATPTRAPQSVRGGIFVHSQVLLRLLLLLSILIQTKSLQKMLPVKRCTPFGVTEVNRRKMLSHVDFRATHKHARSAAAATAKVAKKKPTARTICTQSICTRK